MGERNGRLAWAGLVLLAVLPAVARAAAMPDLVTLGTQVVIYAIAAVSLDLLIGYAGLPSFGHAAFFGFGGYVVAILANWDLVPGGQQALVAWPIAVLACAVLGALIGVMAVRTTGVHFIMITLAFAEMVYFFFQSVETFGGNDGLGFRFRNAVPGLNMRADMTFYYVCLVLLVAFVLLCRRMMRSRFGFAVQGIRQNTRRMAALGLHVDAYRLAAFVVAAAGAGLAGALNANFLRFVSPDMLHWTTSGDLTAMVVLGGAGTLYGPVLGAAVLVVLQQYLAQWTEHWMILLGPFLVAIILFARGGLWGVLGRGRLRPARARP